MLHALENLAHLGKLYSPARKLRELAAVNGKWVIDEKVSALNGKVAEAIAHRLRAAVYRPIRELLAEGVAKPEDVDLGALHALRFTIPPAREMQREAAERQARIIDMMCRYGGV